MPSIRLRTATRELPEKRGLRSPANRAVVNRGLPSGHQDGFTVAVRCNVVQLAAAFNG